MNNKAVSRPTHRTVEDADLLLREAAGMGCGLWLMLNPFCHEQALARLYEHERGVEITELFFGTSLEDARGASPRIAAIGPHSPMLDWLSETDTQNWGMVLASDAPLEEILAHLRSLLLVRTDEDDVIFRFWDGSILSRICCAMPEEIPVLLGPVRRVVTMTHARAWVSIDRDGEALMEDRHLPRPSLPIPWYRWTEGHERALQDQRPAVLAHNIIEALLHEQAGPALPPTERLEPFVARHIERGMALGLWRAEALELFVRCCLLHGESFPEVQPVPGAFSRNPVDEDMAILAMRRTCNHGGEHD